MDNEYNLIKFSVHNNKQIKYLSMDNIVKKCKIKADSDFKLKDHNTAYTSDLKKEDSTKILSNNIAELKVLQEKLYSSNRFSLLLIFQAMDAAGKDSAIEHVMSGINPQGCEVYSFKQPSSEELEHDFLWRHAKALPKKGMIGIHNRSHYENVLVCKVHPNIITDHDDRLSFEDIDEEFWRKRYESIRDFEKHLVRNGTVIIKFFLNVSKEEQKERFLDRINEPFKNWKFSSFDIEERKKWTDYMNAYESAITETSKDHAPWYVIPADKKWFSRMAISEIIKETLKSLDLEIPELSKEELEGLIRSKEELLREE
ncbi:MAG: polyphosphate:nucleotide phosphotransferase, family [Sphingobacteriales bacterium]|nr:polyphosphate:nucleotide phosphotransferase, family [Sphingobacteriales bacterium]